MRRIQLPYHAENSDNEAHTAYPGMREGGNVAHTALPGMGEGECGTYSPPGYERRGGMWPMQPPCVCAGVRVNVVNVLPAGCEEGG